MVTVPPGQVIAGARPFGLEPMQYALNLILRLGSDSDDLSSDTLSLMLTPSYRYLTCRIRIALLSRVESRRLQSHDRTPRKPTLCR